MCEKFSLTYVLRKEILQSFVKLMSKKRKDKILGNKTFEIVISETCAKYKTDNYQGYFHTLYDLFLYFYCLHFIYFQTLWGKS